MPRDFDECVKKGGRVRTVTMPGDRYMHVCYDSKGSHAGEVKHNMKSKGMKEHMERSRRKGTKPTKKSG